MFFSIINNGQRGSMMSFSSPRLFSLSQKMFIKIWTRDLSRMSIAKLRLIFILRNSNLHLFPETFFIMNNTF